MQNLITILASTTIFKGVSAHAISGLAAMGEIRAYSGGDMLVRQYDRAQDLIVILSGRVQVMNFGREVIAELGEGAVLGEVSLIDQSPRSANVVCLEPTQALVIPAMAMRSLMEQDRETQALLYKNISKVLCTRLRSMNALVETSRPLGRRAS